MAPVQGRSHRPLPFGKVSRPTLRQGSVQTRQQGGRAQESRLRRGQLQRERQPGQPPADRRDRRRVPLVQHEGWRGRPSTLHEQAAGGRIEDLFGRRRAGGGGQREGRHRVLLLAPDAQGRAAGDEHDEIRARFDHVGHLGRRPQQVFEVVEHQEQPLLSQAGTQDLTRGPALRLPQAERPRDGRDHERGVVERRQPDERHPVPEQTCGVSRYANSETRLSDASHPREGEQPDLRAAEPVRHLPQVALPAHE